MNDEWKLEEVDMSWNEEANDYMWFNQSTGYHLKNAWEESYIIRDDECNEVGYAIGLDNAMMTADAIARGLEAFI